MYRTLLATLAVSFVSVPAVAEVTVPGTGVLVGNPRAAHRLTIVSAFSCPFCRVLDTQGMAEIQQKWIPSGLQVEFVPTTISPTDLASTIAATCGSAGGYLRRSTILFRAQTSIQGNWNGASEAPKSAAIAKKTAGADAIARMAGVYELAPSLGLSLMQLKQCMADGQHQALPANWDKLASTKWKVVGTPTAFLDGKKVGSTWKEIQTALVRTLGK